MVCKQHVHAMRAVYWMNDKAYGVSATNYQAISSGNIRSLDRHQIEEIFEGAHFEEWSDGKYSKRVERP